ncbi:MAG: mechanosensitive ion channel family protein [Prochlorothrix sp.]
MDPDALLLQNVTSLAVTLQAWLIQFGLKILAAILILLIGLRLARWGRRAVERLLSRTTIDQTLSRFTANATQIGLVMLTIVAVLGQVGVETASLIAVIGSAGLAIGLALQGSLSNLAAGVLLVLLRPFRVGDYIEAMGIGGVVEEIQLFMTLLVTTDNRAVIVPNSKLISDVIINYSAKPQRRVDLIIGVSYDDDLDLVRRVLTEVLQAEERVLAEPPPVIGLLDFADNRVNFVVRPWVNTPDYWSTYYSLKEAIKKRFDAEGIKIPFFPHDLHLIQAPPPPASPAKLPV